MLRCEIIEKKKKKLITFVIDPFPFPEAFVYTLRFSLASLCHQRGGEGIRNILVINIYYYYYYFFYLTCHMHSTRTDCPMRHTPIHHDK